MKNVTCHGKTDGFGCQLNRKLSVAAYCQRHPGMRYIHHPFTSVSHGWRDLSDEINSFLGFPNMRKDNKPHINKKFGDDRVFRNPSLFYTDEFLDKIRSWYWSGAKPITEASSSDCIVVHIRRGDITIGKKHRYRVVPNKYYNSIIPRVAFEYPDNYKILIHSEGSINQFESILDGWPKDLVDRTVFKLGIHGRSDCENNLLQTYHDLVCAKVLVQGMSSLSYTAGLFNSNDVWFVPGNKAKGQRIPHKSWKILPRGK